MSTTRAFAELIQEQEKKGNIEKRFRENSDEFDDFFLQLLSTKSGQQDPFNVADQLTDLHTDFFELHGVDIYTMVKAFLSYIVRNQEKTDLIQKQKPNFLFHLVVTLYKNTDKLPEAMWNDLRELMKNDMYIYDHLYLTKNKFDAKQLSNETIHYLAEAYKHAETAPAEIGAMLRLRILGIIIPNQSVPVQTKESTQFARALFESLILTSPTRKSIYSKDLAAYGMEMSPSSSDITSHLQSEEHYYKFTARIAKLEQDYMSRLGETSLTSDTIKFQREAEKLAIIGVIKKAITTADYALLTKIDEATYPLAMKGKNTVQKFVKEVQQAFQQEMKQAPVTTVTPRERTKSIEKKYSATILRLETDYQKRLRDKSKDPKQTLRRQQKVDALARTREILTSGNYHELKGVQSEYPLAFEKGALGANELEKFIKQLQKDLIPPEVKEKASRPSSTSFSLMSFLRRGSGEKEKEATTDSHSPPPVTKRKSS